MTEIETDRLLLRRWREEDLDAYTRICADPEVMRYMGGPRTHQRCEEQISWFVQHWEERGFGQWAAEERATGAFIGRIGLLYHDDWPEDEHKTEVGWLLDRSFWGRGLATEGARASVRHGFEELELERIISIIHPENTASRRVAEKAKLSLRGETRWRGLDVIWYAIDRPGSMKLTS
jgi:RimJ/RimL family protein N-acetyltransferase